MVGGERCGLSDMWFVVLSGVASMGNGCHEGLKAYTRGNGASPIDKSMPTSTIRAR